MNKHPQQIEAFLAALASGQPILEALRLPATRLNLVSHEQLLANPEDIADGVVKVETNFSTLFFKIFDNLLIKYFDDNRIRCVFFTTTQDADSIIRLSQTLYDKLGDPLNTSDEFIPFSIKDKIKALSRGKYVTPKDMIATSWLKTGFNISISYRVSPLRQLVLMATEVPEKEHDFSVRSKGTIADLLNFDLHTIFSKEPLRRIPEIEGGRLKFTDYYYQLDEPALKIFDVLSVRIFGDDSLYTRQSDINLQLTTSDAIEPEQMIATADRLIRIYGNDDLKQGQLELYEIEDLQAGKHWVGRSWHMNQIHGLYNSNNESEKPAYMLTISYDEEDNGFKLYIYGFNSLLKYFTVDN